ncbi:MAG TPA: hypothetical protein VHN14_17815 [Kofleriaceae bacterium]|jgi:hypothetical protein|nr:hypothetical protein [Kofleriaceae bacterium]
MSTTQNNQVTSPVVPTLESALPAETPELPVTIPDYPSPNGGGTDPSASVEQGTT